MKKILILMLMLGLYGCQSPMTNKFNESAITVKSELKDAVKDNKEISKKVFTMSDTVFSSLVPTVSFDDKETEVTFDISAQNQDAKEFFAGLAKGAGVSIIVSPELEGNISLHMEKVTLNQVMNAISNMYVYEFKKTPYGYDILPGALETRIFAINKLNVIRTGQSSLSVQMDDLSSSDSSSSSSSSSTSSNNKSSSSSLSTVTEDNYWENLEDTIKLIIGDKNDEAKSVVINTSSGVIAVRAYPKQLRKVAAFLDASEAIGKRQVLIETKVLEVALDDRFASGINWNIDGFNVVQTTNSGDAGLPTNVISGVFADNIIATINRHDSLNAVMNLLSSQGRVSVISSPRISTMNNQKAVIKIGTDEYYATDYSADTVTSTATSSSTDLGLEPFFSGVALDVTPQIDKDMNIMLHIHPIISSVSEQEKSFTIEDSLVTLPLAVSSIRESDSIVYAKSGQVVVIGGLMQRTVDMERSKMPVPKSISSNEAAASVLDALGSKYDLVTRSELVILLRPVVVNNNSTSQSIGKSIKNINAISESR
jgi:MSHA biogenesis protein MshL